MKVIASFGGPFIGMNRKDVPHWSGVFGKNTIGSQSPFASDYEAACNLSGRANLAFDSAGYFPNLSSDAFLIAPPVETALIIGRADAIVIAQVEAAEEDWSFSDIGESVLKHARFSGDHRLVVKEFAAEYVLFDSSVDGRSIQDYLSLNFNEGIYHSSSAMYNQDDVAQINLFRFSMLS